VVDRESSEQSALVTIRSMYLTLSHHMAMQVAEHNPYCVLPRNLLHTDVQFDIGTEKVLFPNFWLRPGPAEDFIEIEWTTRIYYERQKGVRIPYQNKTGKIRCNTLQGNGQRPNRAEWQISINS